MAKAAEKDQTTPATGSSTNGRKTEVTYLVTVTGKSPIMFDRMSEETIQGLIDKERPPVRTDIDNKLRAEGKLYLSREGKIGIPVVNMLSCMREAGRKIKVGGKEQISTAATTQMYGILSIESDFLEFEGEPEAVIDVRRGVMHNAGKDTTVGIVRPMFRDWSFTFKMTVDYLAMEGLTFEHIQKLLQIAGNRIGLCSFRPACNGPFGRFRVKMEEVEGDEG